MRQILIASNPQIKQLAGSQIEFLYQSNAGDPLVLELLGGKPTAVRIPFSAKIISGGTLDLDFKLPESIAERGIQLLGAYWDGKVVTAYLSALLDNPTIIPDGASILIGTLVQLATYRQISEGTLGSIVDLNAETLTVTTKPKQERKRRKKI
jgi:hypothetical protein